jgi:hypothetical protein
MSNYRTVWIWHNAEVNRLIARGRVSCAGGHRVVLARAIIGRDLQVGPDDHSIASIADQVHHHPVVAPLFVTFRKSLPFS